MQPTRLCHHLTLLKLTQCDGEIDSYALIISNDGRGGGGREGDTERMDVWGVKKEGYAALPILAMVQEPESGIPHHL